jgi:serine/threonine protein kinase
VNYYDPDTMFGSVAVRLGLVDPNEARLCAQLKQQSGGQYSLEHILLQRGSLSPYNAQVIRQHLTQYKQSSGMAAAPPPSQAYPPPSQAFNQNPSSGLGQRPEPGYQPAPNPEIINSQAPVNSQYRPQLGPMSAPQPHFSNHAAAPNAVPNHNPVNSSFAPAVAVNYSAHSPSSAFISSVSARPGSTKYNSPDTSGGVLYNSQSSELPNVGDTFGRYKIESILGKGGMGIVFKAVHLDLARTVAMKMMVNGAATSDKQLKRFFIEARSAARLSHPAIVPIHDVGELHGLHYFTMDYVKGTDLDSELRNRSFPEKESLALIKQLADALDYAHANDVIHRDLKPANILIDDTEVPKITDFGVAKDVRVNDGETMSGEVLGTPAYMSPEQADGSSKKLDGRSDIFSLGTILYEMLYKDQAFKGATQYAVVTQVLTVDPDPPAIERANVSPEAEAICFKCMEKNPSKRYARGKDLADDISRFLRGKKPHAPVHRQKKAKGGFNTQLFVIELVIALFLLILTFGFMYVNQLDELATLDEISKRLTEELTNLNDRTRKMREANMTRANQQMLRARQKMDQGDIEGALQDGQSALGLDPDTPVRVLSYLQLVLEGFKSAGDSLTNSEKIIKDGMALIAATEDADVAKQMAIKKVEFLWLNNDSLATRKALAKALDKYPELGQKAFSYRYHGLLAEQDGSWRVAISEFKSLLKKDNDYRIRARLARAYVVVKAWDLALKEAEAALKNDPDLALALYAKAAALYDAKNYRKAQAPAKHAAGIRSDVQSKADKLVKDIAKRLKRSQRPKPKKPAPVDEVKHQQGHRLIKAALALSSAGKIEECVNKVEELEAFGLSCPAGFNSLGILEDRCKRPSQALSAFDSAIRVAIQRKSQRPIYYSNRAYILMQLRRFSESLTADRQAVDLYFKLPVNKRSESNLSYMARTRDKCFNELIKMIRVGFSKKRSRGISTHIGDIRKTINKLREHKVPVDRYKAVEAFIYTSQGDLYATNPNPEVKKRALPFWRAAVKHSNQRQAVQINQKIAALEKQLNQ